MIRSQVHFQECAVLFLVYHRIIYEIIVTGHGQTATQAFWQLGYTIRGLSNPENLRVFFAHFATLR
jgi:hypothetical protein